MLVLTAWMTRGAAGDDNWARIMDAHLLAQLRMSRSGRAMSPWWLVGSIWTLTVLALAGPAWKRVPTTAFRSPAAWVLVLDLSPSMAATDLIPDRATRARYAAADLLSAARDARVGLVVFAGEPHTVAPLTTDVATVGTLLRPLTPALMPETGNNLAPALDEAQQLLQASYARHGQIIVLSDGFADPAAAFSTAERLRRLGTSVNVVGVGTEAGAPEPDGKGQFVLQADGRPRMARIQSDELRRVAAAGGGEYVPLSEFRKLIERFESQQSQQSGQESSDSPGAVAKWRNEGVWLLPIILLLGTALARRGWV
jgi:Ca-activated chloride channel homolog